MNRFPADFCRTLSTLFLLTDLGGTVVAADWPQWRGPQRNGQAASVRAVEPGVEFERVWTANVGTGFSSLAVVGERVYTLGNRDDRETIWCLDAATGDVLWRHEYPSPLDPNLFEGGPTATPAVAAGRVFTVSRRGDVFCLDAASGEVRWSQNLVTALNCNVPTWGFAGSPLVEGDRLLLNAGSHGLCLEAATGRVVWSSDNSEDAGYSSPLVVRREGASLVLVMSAKSLHAVDVESGRRRWSLPWITRYGINAADPVVVDEWHLLVSSGYGKGTALVRFDADGAELVWRTRDLRNQMAPGLLLEGHLYAVDGDDGGENALVCLEALSGEVRWRSGGYGSATLIALGSQFGLLSQSGELLLANADPRSFDVVVRGHVGSGKFWTPPVYAAESFFVRNAGGEVSRIRVVR